MEEIIQEIKDSNLGRIEENVSLKKYTTYRSGGTARCIVYPKDIPSLVTILRMLQNQKIDYKIIGNGSNLLFSDKPYDKILIKLSEFDWIDFFGRNKVRVGAGFPLIKLCIMAMKKSLTGLEFASGIPGTVGGSIFMNAGAYKSDMGYIVQSVKILTKDLRIINLENKEMDFHYRSSYLQKHPGTICLEVVLKLHKGKKDAINEVMQERRERRLASQPLEYPSAGSVFRNPEGNFAGKLIEDVGLKGMKHGGAMISEKHANFIVNYKDASSEDIKYLMDLCKKKVKDEFDIDLKVEQELVNWE